MNNPMLRGRIIQKYGSLKNFVEPMGLSYPTILAKLSGSSGWTQAEIAKLLDICQSDYSKYELGKHMMGIDKYIKLATYYNVLLDYLAGITDTIRNLDGTPYKISKNINITK